ncbi:MAG: type VII secretion target [Mycobacterium sp.]
MSDVAVDPAELTKCADYLDQAATAAQAGRDAVKDASDGVNLMTGSKTTANPESVWYTHGSVSNAFSQSLATAMSDPTTGRDAAAAALVQACKDLAASLRQAADVYTAQDQGNADSLNNQLS